MTTLERPRAGAGHNCLRCGVGPLVPGGRRRPRGTPRSLVHIGRGLGGDCYDELWLGGGLDEWPLLTRSTKDLAKAAERIKAERGWSWRDIAEELGVSRAALERAVHRQRAVVRATAGGAGR